MYDNGFFVTVSIHASVKDATVTVDMLTFIVTVSIHASVKDATAFGRDIYCSSDVSIHASVKDATQSYIIFLSGDTFQSTHP